MPRRCGFCATSSFCSCTRIRTGTSSSRTGTCERRIRDRRTLAGLPRLYQKYAGHDNNRDFYMGTQAETINMSRVLFRGVDSADRLRPSSGARDGALMVAPPFEGPSNYVFDPLVMIGIDAVGESIHRRVATAERKPGVDNGKRDRRTPTWWNGGLRTTATFHNQIGILTETAGGPTPMPTGCGAISVAPGDRLLGDREPRRAGHRITPTRNSGCSTSMRWGGTRSNGAVATGGRRRLTGPGEGRAIRDCATRARTSFPRISPIS